MRFLISCTLAILSTLVLTLTTPSPVHAETGTNIMGFAAKPMDVHPLRSKPSMGVIPGLGHLFTGTPPTNLGIHDNQLSACPDTPNCVNSQTADETHAIAPLTYQGDRDTARSTLLKVLSVVPRTQVIEQRDNYIRTEFSTALMGFVDDGEFYLPEDQKLIHVRSAARLGESDLNLNRRRLEQIRLAMSDLNA